MTGSLNSTIVFVGHNATQTGAPKSLLKIISWFVESTDFKIIVILNNDGLLLPEYKQIAETHLWNTSGRVLKRVPVIRYLFNYWRQKNIIRKVKQLNPICIFNNTGVNGSLVKVLKIATSSIVVSRIPELEAFMRRNAQNGSVQATLKYSDYVIAVSESVKKNLISRHDYPDDKISVVYGACDEKQYLKTNEFRKKIGATIDDTIICGCGTMDWRKGYDLFIQTAEMVCKRNKRLDIKFVWIGSPVTVETGIEYDYEIEFLDLNNNFFRSGAVDVPSEYFASADAFFLSSREDPFPLVMLEAARQALPIVCFENSGGAVEFVDERIGRIVPMLNINVVADTIIELANNKEIAVSKGLAAAMRSYDYTAERMCENIYSIIRDVMGGEMEIK